MEQWAAIFSPAFFHLSITLADWFPESHTSILQLYPGLCCPPNATFTPQDNSFQICSLFQSKLVAKLEQTKPKETFFFTLFTIPIISSAVLYYTVKVNALLCWLTLFYWSVSNVKWFIHGSGKQICKWVSKIIMMKYFSHILFKVSFQKMRGMTGAERFLSHQAVIYTTSTRVKGHSINHRALWGEINTSDTRHWKTHTIILYSATHG